MNEHIELVKKWLADKESVSQEELQSNLDAAKAAYTADAGAAAAYAACAAIDADYGAADNAAHYVKQYEELTK